MTINPYESPPPTEPAETAPPDPLRFPAVGCALFGGLGVAMTTLGLALLLAAWCWGRTDAFNGRNIWSELGGSVGYLFLSLLCLYTAYCLHKRQRRWVVLLAALLSFVPLTGCVGAPLGALILYRLWSSETWRSFK